MRKIHYTQIVDLVEFINLVFQSHCYPYRLSMTRLYNSIEIIRSGEIIFRGVIWECYSYLKSYLISLIKFS